MKTLQENPQLEETVTIADFEKTFNSSPKTQRKSLAKEILTDTYELLDFKDTGYKPTHTDYDSFVTDFSAYIRQKVEPEAYRHDAQRALAHVRALQTPNSKAFKTLEHMADNVGTKKQYEAVVKTAADLGDKGSRRVYNKLKSLRVRLRKGDESAIKEAQIPGHIVQEMITNSHRLFDSIKNPYYFSDAFKDKKNSSLSEILTAVGDVVMQNIAKGLNNPDSPFMGPFLGKYGLSCNDFRQLKKGSFSYHEKLKPANTSLKHYKEIFGKSKDMKSGINNLVNAIALNTLRKKDPEQKFETGNIIVDYSFRTRKLDVILRELTRDACINKCKHEDPRCCDANYFNRSVSSQILAIQQLEALKNKVHLRISTRDDGECNYHNVGGCKLTLFKSPLCMGHLCSAPRENLPGLEDDKNLQYSHDQPYYYFLQAMSGFRGCTLDLATDWLKRSQGADPTYHFPGVLTHLDSAIKFGSEIVKLKHERLRKQAKKKTKRNSKTKK
ncbi:hypothetical protein GOV14_03070 [Candidatus Pacearchaeota archaeon]|nr:hypothetical protein [Candidatus Pacearchaeota archaeon]